MLFISFIISEGLFVLLFLFLFLPKFGRRPASPGRGRPLVRQRHRLQRFLHNLYWEICQFVYSFEYYDTFTNPKVGTISDPMETIIISASILKIS